MSETTLYKQEFIELIKKTETPMWAEVTIKDKEDDTNTLVLLFSEYNNRLYVELPIGDIYSYDPESYPGTYHIVGQDYEQNLHSLVEHLYKKIDVCFTNLVKGRDSIWKLENIIDKKDEEIEKLKTKLEEKNEKIEKLEYRVNELED